MSLAPTWTVYAAGEDGISDQYMGALPMSTVAVALVRAGGDASRAAGPSPCTSGSIGNGGGDGGNDDGGARWEGGLDGGFGEGCCAGGSNAAGGGGGGSTRDAS